MGGPWTCFETAFGSIQIHVYLVNIKCIWGDWEPAEVDGILNSTSLVHSDPSKVEGKEESEEKIWKMRLQQEHGVKTDKP